MRGANRPPQVKRWDHETEVFRGQVRRTADRGSQRCLVVSSGNNGWVVLTDEIPLRSLPSGEDSRGYKA